VRSCRISGVNCIPNVQFPPFFATVTALVPLVIPQVAPDVGGAKVKSDAGTPVAPAISSLVMWRSATPVFVMVTFVTGPATPTVVAWRKIGLGKNCTIGFGLAETGKLRLQPQFPPPGSLFVIETVADPTSVLYMAGTVTSNTVPPNEGVPPVTELPLKITSVLGTNPVPVKCNWIGAFTRGEPGVKLSPVGFGIGFMTVNGSAVPSVPAGSLRLTWYTFPS